MTKNLIAALDGIADEMETQDAFSRLAVAIERLTTPSACEDDAEFERKHPRGDKGRFSSTSSLTKTGAQSFHKTLTEAKESQPETSRWRVDIHGMDDYEKTANYVSNGGSTVALKDGDIISVCKHKGVEDMKASELMSIAVKLGGVKLDSFDGNYRFYRKCGFEPVSWTPFNEQYAPDGWVKGRDKPEDVIFFVWTGNKRKMTRQEADAEMKRFKSDNKPFTGDNGYDDAMKQRDERLNIKGKEQK